MALKSINADQGLLWRLRESGVLLGAYANRLTPVDPTWTLASSDGPQPFRKDVDERQYWTDFIQAWIKDYGVQLVGGCCGITPEHIAYISKQIHSDQAI